MVQLVFIMWIAGTYANGDMDTKYRATFMLTFELSKLYTCWICINSWCLSARDRLHPASLLQASTLYKNKQSHSHLQVGHFILANSHTL